MIRLDPSYTESFADPARLAELWPEVLRAHDALVGATGEGSDYLGWRTLLDDPNDALLEDIASTSERIRADADVLVCIGIGGSYLGAQAVIQALTPYFQQDGPEIVFAGHHMSGAYHRELLQYLEGKSVYVNVISKSGTTLEPALAFRFLRDWLEAHFDDADERIIVTTDPERGALNVLREEKGYKKYVIPPDVGGRFSVLTPVGLLPIAVAGVDVRALFYGAVEAYGRFNERADSYGSNPALDYAAIRSLLYRDGYRTELLAVFEPRLSGIGGWWQQLFGESEGKENKGLFPASVQYSTDLHSLGQYVQEGERLLIETFLIPERDGGSLEAPGSDANLDGLDYLQGKPYTHVNRKAYEGTAKAHASGGVPNMAVKLSDISPQSIGALIYFFEHAVAVSGYLLGVNPFDQPGVEAYKKEMFSLLGKP